MDFWSALHNDLQKSITTNKIYYLKSISYYENSKTIVHKSVLLLSTDKGIENNLFSK